MSRRIKYSSENLKIETGIPVPPIEYKTERTKVFEKMNRMDSVLFKDIKEAKSFCQSAANKRVKTIFRRVEKGWRVWKISI